MTILDYLTSDSVVAAGILLWLVLSIGVGLWLLSTPKEADSLDVERAQRWYTDARRLDEYRHHAYQAERNRNGRR